MENLTGKRIAILVADGCEEEELTPPREALEDAGVVEGRRTTSYRPLRTDLISAGTGWIDVEVVEDHGPVTSRDPGDGPAFNGKILQVFQAGEIHTQGPDAQPPRDPHAPREKKVAPTES